MNSCGLRLLILQNNLLMHTRSQANQAIEQGFKNVESKQQFHMTANSDIATINYKKTGNVYVLVHSFVPESKRGHGLGHELALGAFNYADQHNLKLKITCGFLRKVFSENNEKYKHLLVE